MRWGRLWGTGAGFGLLLIFFSAGPLYAMGKSSLGRRQLIEGPQAQTFPFSMIGKLDSSVVGSDTSTCTAVRVGQRIILSAAHCFYWVSPKDPELKQGDPTGNQHLFTDPLSGREYRVTSWQTGTQYAPGTDASADLHSGKDWAVGILEESIPVETQYLSPAPAGLQLAAKTPVSSAGFSMDIYDGDVLTEDPSCEVISQTPNLLQTNCQVSEGDSGGPDLVRGADGKIYVAGIHSLLVESQPPTSISTSIEMFRAAIAQAENSVSE